MNEDTVSEPTRSQRWYEKLSLIQATMILIVAAALLVTVGYLVYWHSQDRKYDIARPGSADKNAAVEIEEDTFNNDTSPIDSAAIENKRNFLINEKKALKDLNNFSNKSLSDQNLLLVPITEPSL